MSLTFPRLWRIRNEDYCIKLSRHPFHFVLCTTTINDHGHRCCGIPSLRETLTPEVLHTGCPFCAVHRTSLTSQCTVRSMLQRGCLEHTSPNEVLLHTWRRTNSPGLMKRPAYAFEPLSPWGPWKRKAEMKRRWRGKASNPQGKRFRMFLTQWQLRIYERESQIWRHRSHHQGHGRVVEGVIRIFSNTDCRGIHIQGTQATQGNTISCRIAVFRAFSGRLGHDVRPPPGAPSSLRYQSILPKNSTLTSSFPLSPLC